MAVSEQQPRLRISWEQDDDLVLSLAPLQGLWTDEQYLTLSDQTNRLIEFTHGVIEVLPMPTDQHQVILLVMYEVLKAFLQPLGGKVLVAPLRLLVGPRKHREPDIVLLRDATDPRRQNRQWLGADLVVEIVSADDPERDTIVKRAEYAQAGIPEYWIVNPLDETITVLTLRDGYEEHGIFRRGATATSHLLSGFGVAVDAVFDAE